MVELQTLINDNERLIHEILKKYKGITNYSVFDYEDLYQEAIVGFIKAYRTFDKSSGSKFTTYATKVIRNHLADFTVFNNNHVKFPHYFTKVWNAMDEYETDNANVLSEKLDMPIKKIMKAIVWKENKETKQFDESRQSKVEDDISIIFVNEFVSKFDNDNKRVIRLRMDEHTQTEIGIELNLSQSKISIMIDNIGKELSIYIKDGETV